MFARRFTISSSIVSKMMKKNQKLSTSSETDLSVSKMKKKPNVSKSQVITTSPLREAMKKQNDADWFLTGKVIASEARHSNFVFSPASLNAAVAMVEAAGARSASEERKALSSEIATVVFADGSKKGGPKITAINGVWVESNHSLLIRR
ncbi:unnamed protein product [Microthlaspi erraticum]|uniref:Serpin domain-containing protein n=1 Tax=Microthlaspi erraticum TaxID=1685480 RepID=A0A6D2L142_9BRAS|nr:unnamed protein product [Microthlaspi erraticum]